jgi:hypothetical protein
LRAWGMPGGDAPAASRANDEKHTSVVTTGPPDQPGIPARNGFTAYFALSPVTGLVCHRRLADQLHKT